MEIRSSFAKSLVINACSLKTSDDKKFCNLQKFPELVYSIGWFMESFLDKEIEDEEIFHWAVTSKGLFLLFFMSLLSSDCIMRNQFDPS